MRDGQSESWTAYCLECGPLTDEPVRYHVADTAKIALELGTPAGHPVPALRPWHTLR